MTEPNMKIEISLSDDTLAKLAKIFAPAPVPVVPDSLVWKPTTTPVKQTQVEETITSIIEDLVEVPSASLLEAVDETIEALPLKNDTDQCGWVAGRLSKKLRINDKKNDRIGQGYWCQKGASHSGKHIEGWPPVYLIDSFRDSSNEVEEPEVAKSLPSTPAGNPKTNPDGRTVIVGPSEKPAGGLMVTHLNGYSDKLNNKKACGWWMPAGQSYGKFCELEPGHSDSNISSDHEWVSPAPPMVRA